MSQRIDFSSSIDLSFATCSASSRVATEPTSLAFSVWEWIEQRVEFFATPLKEPKEADDGVVAAGDPPWAGTLPQLRHWHRLHAVLDAEQLKTRDARFNGCCDRYRVFQCELLTGEHNLVVAVKKRMHER